MMHCAIRTLGNPQRAPTHDPTRRRKAWRNGKTFSNHETKGVGSDFGKCRPRGHVPQQIGRQGPPVTRPVGNKPTKTTDLRFPCGVAPLAPAHLSALAGDPLWGPSKGGRQTRDALLGPTAPAKLALASPTQNPDRPRQGSRWECLRRIPGCRRRSTKPWKTAVNKCSPTALLPGRFVRFESPRQGP